MNKPKIINFLFILILSIICFKQYPIVLRKAIQQTQTLIKHELNYENLRNTYPLHKTIQEAKDYIKEGSADIIAFEKSIDYKASKYWLYPIKIENGAPYLIDLTGLVEIRPRLNSTPIYKGKIYAHPGYFFVSTNQSKPLYPRIQIFLCFLGISLFFTSIGLLLLRILSFTTDKDNLVWFLSTSYLIGFFISAGIMWVLMLCQIPLTLYSIFIGWTSILCFMAILAFTKKMQSAFYTNNESDSPTDTSNPTSLRSFLRIFSFALLGLIVLILTLLIAVTPLQSPDSFDWALRAKVIHTNQSLDLSYLTKTYNNYPLLWPINIATQYSLLNNSYDEIIKWTNALLFILLVIQLLKGLSLLKIDKAFAYFSVIVYLAIFFAENPFNTAMPETAFITFLTCALVLIIQWMNDTQKVHYLYLSIFFACALNLIKLEGMFASLFLLFSILATQKQKSRQWIKPMIFLGATILLPLLWVGWTKAHGYFHQSVHFQSSFNWNKIIVLANANWQHSLAKSEWIILLIPAAYLLISNKRKPWTTTELFLLFMTGLLLIFKWGAPLFWTEKLIMAEGIFPDGAWRLLLHVSPALFFLLNSRGQRSN